jgi:tetratricopeptide (TPR) repeat protein
MARTLALLLLLAPGPVFALALPKPPLPPIPGGGGSSGGGGGGGNAAAIALADEDVRKAEDLLVLTGGNVTAAQEKKRARTEALNEALQRIGKLKYRPISRHFAKKKARDREREYNDANENLNGQQSAHNNSGQLYLEAEERYKNAAGDYRNPDQVAYWKSQLTGSLGEEVEDVAADQPLDTGAVRDQTSSFGRDMSDILKGGLTGESAGKMMAKARQMDKYNTSVMQAVAKNGLRSKSGNTPPPPGTSNGIPTRTKATRSSGITTAALNRPILISGRRGAVEATASKAESAYHKGGQAMRRGDSKKAIQAADFIIANDPNSFRGFQLKARALNRERRFAEALVAANAALERNPNDVESLRQKAWAELHLEKYAEAERSASRMIQLNPEGAQGYLLRAFAREKLGNREGMLADLRMAANLDSRYKAHLAKALAGLGLFNPDAEDSYKLLGAISFKAPISRGNPVTGLGLLLILAAGSMLLIAPLKKLFERYQRRVRTSPMGLGKTAGAVAKPAKIEELPVKLLAGKYRLDRIVGKGGMGRVWQGWDVSLERAIAVKQTVQNVGDIGSQVRKIYLKEATTLARLNHPNIVNIFDAIDRDDGVYLVFEYVAGKTTQQLIAEKQRISWQSAREFLSSACEGLQFAHDQGFIHRDLKPANIMITDEGFVKIMDFGIAHALTTKPVKMQAVGVAPTDALTDRTRSIAGTPTYMSPEAHQGVVAPSVDIFALGVCLYEFLTARYPYGREGWSAESARGFVPASQIVPGLPRAVDQVIADALDADYTKRIATATEFKNRLDAI